MWESYGNKYALNGRNIHINTWDIHNLSGSLTNGREKKLSQKQIKVNDSMMGFWLMDLGKNTLQF